MKKTLSLLALGIVMGSSFTLVSASSSRIFSDVYPSDWYAEAVENLFDKGIVTGYSDGTFGPEKTPNRAELAAILDRTLDYIKMDQESVLGFEKAKALAKESCIGEASFTGEYDYMPDRDVWSFEMKTTKKYCIDVRCTVDETTQTADMEWLCTGAEL